MKRLFSMILLCIFLLAGCGGREQPAQIAATTLPVYEFTTRLCQGTPLTVTRLVTETVSCLHDYSLNVKQVKAAESAELIVISGAGLEESLEEILTKARTIDASHGIELIVPEEHHHKEEQDEGGEHEEADSHDHHHDTDPHIWLSPANAKIMAENICQGLCDQYPSHSGTFLSNLEGLLADLEDLEQYGLSQLNTLSCRELITFHDGFAYLADAFDLTILDAIEEESGSEASAKELIHMIREVELHRLPAIFTEKSGSVSAAGIIARETGAKEFSLDMAMAGDSYFDSMYHNIDTLKEALQ
ncbi:MAG: metal ABC transporter substrate-binding protein [Faecousia sp.]